MSVQYGEAQLRCKADAEARLAMSEVGWSATGEGGSWHLCPSLYSRALL